MFFKKLFFLGLIVFYAQSGFAFTVINQTDSEKVLKIREAYRPLSDESDNPNTPVPLGHPAHKFTVAAHSTYTFDLAEPCSVLLVRVIKTSVEDGVEVKTASKTYHEPYDYQDFYDCLTCEYFNEPLLTDSWGIVFHKPIIGLDDSLSLEERVLREEAMQLGYGIRCLDPKLLEKMMFLDELKD